MQRFRLFSLALPAILAATQVAVAQIVTTGRALNWTAPTAYTDGTPLTGALTYNVYQGVKAGPFVKVSSVLTATNTLIVNTTAGNCFAVTALDSKGNESLPSPTICALQPSMPGDISVAITITVK